MKYLILLIPTLALAAIKVEITNFDNSKVFRGKFETVEEANSWIADNESNDSWGKKDHWKDLEKGETEERCQEVREVVSEEDLSVKKQCFIPQNFEVIVTDITEEENAKKQAKLEEKQELQEIKEMVETIRKSDKPNWEKKLLIRLIKELGDS